MMFSTKKRLSLFAVVGSVVAIVAVAAAPPSAMPVSAGANEIVGTWRAAVSGAPGFPDFFSLMVFDKRNTMTEKTNDAASSMSSGVWEKIDGDDDANFAVTFEFWVDEDFNGVADFRFQVRLTIQVDDDTLTGTATLDILAVDGTALGITIPGFTFEGSRMTVIPE